MTTTTTNQTTTSSTANAIVSKLASFEPVPAMLSVEALLTSLNKDGEEKQKLVSGLLTLDTVIGGSDPYVFSVNFSYNGKTENCLKFSIDSQGQPSYTVNRNKLFGTSVFSLTVDSTVMTFHQLAFWALDNVANVSNVHNDKGYVIFSLLVDKLDIKPEGSFPYHAFTKSVLAQCCKEAITQKAIDTDYTRLYLYASAQSKLANKA